jgi:hypothetical protein
VSGKTASVTLTEDCFAITGQIGIAIRVTSGTTKTTVLKANYNVEQFSTDNPVDPSSRVALDVGDLVNRIDAATADIPASDMASLMAGIAPTFSTSTNYAAGAYVYYNGTLYRFTTAHAAGSWTGTDATAAVLGNDVADLKSAFGELPNINLFNKSNRTVGFVKQDGTETDTATWNKTDYMPINPEYPYYYQGISTPGGSPYSAFYNSSKTFISSFKQASGANMLPEIPSNAAFVRFSVYDSDLNTFKFYNGMLPDLENHHKADKKIFNQVLDIEANTETKANLTWENGSISNGVDNLNATGIKTTYIPLFGRSFKVRATVSDLSVYLVEYDKNYNYLETHSTGTTFINPVNDSAAFVRIATYSTTVSQVNQRSNVEGYWVNSKVNPVHYTGIVQNGTYPYCQRNIDLAQGDKITLFIKTNTSSKFTRYILYYSNIRNAGNSDFDADTVQYFNNQFITFTVPDNYKCIRIVVNTSETESGFDFDAYIYKNVNSAEDLYFQNAIQEVKTFSVIGDSWSAYKKYLNPSTNRAFYPPWETDVDGATSGSDVDHAEEMWWARLESFCNVKLMENNSYSGSPICFDGTGSGTADAKTYSFANRVINMVNADAFFVLGGTNDGSAQAEIGDAKYSEWSDTDLTKFKPAVCFLLNYIKTRFPLAKVFFMIPPDLANAYKNAIMDVCNHYGVPYVTLWGMSYLGYHPNSASQEKIAVYASRLLAGYSD